MSIRFPSERPIASVFEGTLSQKDYKNAKSASIKGAEASLLALPSNCMFTVPVDETLL